MTGSRGPTGIAGTILGALRRLKQVIRQSLRRWRHSRHPAPAPDPRVVPDPEVTEKAAVVPRASPATQSTVIPGDNAAAPAVGPRRARRPRRPFPEPSDLAPVPVRESTGYMVRSLNSTTNKPLHVGHLRNLSLAAALASSLEALGIEVIRGCILEDTGRYVMETIAGVRELEQDRDAQQAAPRKPDHYVGHAYRRHRAGHTTGAAGIGYAARNDEADRLMRAWVAGDGETLAAWRRVRQLALDGQEQTLRRIGISFDYCDFESAEDERAAQLIADGLDAGLFTRGSGSTVFFHSDGRYSVRLVNSAGFPEETARLLSFNREIFRSRYGDLVHANFAGSEWKTALAGLTEVMAGLGLERAREMYDPKFYGMVRLNGKKVSSSSGPGLLVDQLLDRLEQSEAAIALEGETGGRHRARDFAAMALKAFVLATPRVEVIDFTEDRLMDRSSPGWIIASAWARLAGAGGGTSPGTCSDQLRAKLNDAVSRASFEAAASHAASLGRGILDGRHDGAIRTDFVVAVGALSLRPGPSDFTFATTPSFAQAVQTAPRLPDAAARR